MDDSMPSRNPTKQPQTKDASSIILPSSPRIIRESEDEWKTWRQSYITTAAPSPVSKQENDKTKEKTVESTKDETLPKDALEVNRQWIISYSKTGILNGRRLGTLVLRLLCEQEEIMDRRRQVSKPWTIARPTPAASSTTMDDATTTTALENSSSLARTTSTTINSNQKNPLQHQIQLESDRKETPTDVDDTLESKELSELSESESMLRQIEWHVVLLLELWIHHRERLVQELYPLLLVLQHSRQEAQKKEEKEKRKWKRRNKPSKTNSDKTSKKVTKKKPKKTKHGKESSSKFSACAFIQKQLGKCQTVMEQTPSLVSKMQTATPQDKELQLLNHIANILSQAAFFLPAEQSMTAFMTEKCLNLRIWKALPQVITHVYDDLERSNPYLEHPPEDPFPTVNILTTTTKKKKKKKNSKQPIVSEKKEAPSRPKLLSQKRDRLQAGGHFHHRSRAAQSSMSEVLKHLSPIRNKSSTSWTDGNRSKVMVSNQKTPRNSSTSTTSSAGKNNRYLSRNSSQLVTPHGSKSAKAAVDSRKKPTLSLSTCKTKMIPPSTTNNKASRKPAPVETRTKKENRPRLQLEPSTANKASRKPAPVVTTTKKEDRPRLQLEPSKSIRLDSEFQQSAQMSPQKSRQNPDSQLARRNTTGTIPATKKDTLQRSRSVGLFPLSPIPTNRASMSESTAMMQTPTRNPRPDALLTPVRKFPLAIDGHENEKNHGNRPLAPMLTPQRYCQARVAETPDFKTLPTPKRYHTPVRRHHLSSNAAVAETPDPSAAKRSSNDDMIVSETPQRPLLLTKTAAETPQHFSTTVAETPEPVNNTTKVASIDSIDWEAAPQANNSTIEPLQLFGGVKEPEKKKPRRVYSLGGGSKQSTQQQQQQPKNKTSKDEMVQDRRHVTHAVLSQARAFMRRKSFEK